MAAPEENFSRRTRTENSNELFFSRREDDSVSHFSLSHFFSQKQSSLLPNTVCSFLAQLPTTTFLLSLLTKLSIFHFFFFPSASILASSRRGKSSFRPFRRDKSRLKTRRNFAQLRWKSFCIGTFCLNFRKLCEILS
jgi:hypothetical protein